MADGTEMWRHLAANVYVARVAQARPRVVFAQPCCRSGHRDAVRWRSHVSLEGSLRGESCRSQIQCSFWYLPLRRVSVVSGWLEIGSMMVSLWCEVADGMCRLIQGIFGAAGLCRTNQSLFPYAPSTAEMFWRRSGGMASKPCWDEDHWATIR